MKNKLIIVSIALLSLTGCYESKSSNKSESSMDKVPQC